MSHLEDAAYCEEIPQNFIRALDDKKICLALALAACVLMASDRDLSPDDAALDACQVYHYLLGLHSRQKSSDN